MWVPGSQTEIALVTDTFVKMYDLSLDAISPSYYYIVCSGKIKDACILVVDNVSNGGNIPAGVDSLPYYRPS